MLFISWTIKRVGSRPAAFIFFEQAALSVGAREPPQSHVVRETAGISPSRRSMISVRPRGTRPAPPVDSSNSHAWLC